ncbi:MAG: galactose-1-phosphate uridylyltransferase [Thermoguttaceae bacterium]
MPEFRRDPISGRWVVMSPERSGRPYYFSDDASDNRACPFCAGNESLTPDEIDSLPDKTDSAKSASNWRIRVVPNLYPAVAADPRFPDYTSFSAAFGSVLDVDTPLSCFEEPFYTPIAGVGHHEVIIDTPRHIMSLGEMTDVELNELVTMYQHRIIHHGHGKRFAYVTLFKNVGRAAGASIPHAHSQLMALPLIPPPIQRELQRAISFRNETRKCYWCEHVRREIDRKTRLVEATRNFAVLCPYVSRFPYEMVIFPRRHVSHIEHLTPDHLHEMAGLLHRCVTRLELASTQRGRGLPAYNLILKSGPLVYSGPLDSSDTSDSTVWIRDIDFAYEQVYHFHWLLIPALAKPAGFEWGCGLHINSVPPEVAAETLRAIEL